MKTRRQMIIQEKLKREKIRRDKLSKSSGSISSNSDNKQKRLLMNIIRNARKAKPIVSRSSEASAPVPENKPPEPMVITPFPLMTGTFKHSGDLGDLWYSLPVVRYLGGGEMQLNPHGLSSKKIDGTDSGFTQALINLCEPLLEIQPYISRVKTWKKDAEVLVNIDDFRRYMHLKDGSLCKSILYSFSVPLTELDTPWITCNEKQIAETVFARSARFQNPAVVEKLKSLLKEKRDCIFVGLLDEHRRFQRDIGNIAYRPVKNFLEMAEIINGSNLFIGNQSSPMAIAVGLNKPFIQEVCAYCPDCRFDSHRPHSRYLE